MSFFKPSATTRSLPPQPVCGEGNVRAEDAFKDQKLYDALVDSFSMRSFVPSAGVSGHDQFFATFDRFGGIDNDPTPASGSTKSPPAPPRRTSSTSKSWRPRSSRAVASSATTIAWPIDACRPRSQSHRRCHRHLTPTSARLRDSFSPAACATRSPSTARSSTMPSTPATRSSTAATPSATPACSVKIRFLYQVLRGFPPQQVFAQTLLGFERRLSIRPSHASSASTSFSPKTATSPCPSTTARC